MPHCMDGPMLEEIPQRPERNALPDKLKGLLDRVMGNHDRPGDTDFGVHNGLGLRDLGQHDRPDGGHVAGEGPRLGGHHFGDLFPNMLDLVRGERTPDDIQPTKGDDQARVAPAAADATAMHFDAETEYTRHLDHLNSQALTQHADWLML